MIIIGTIIFGVSLEYESSIPQLLTDQTVYFVISISHCTCGMRCTVQYQ